VIAVHTWYEGLWLCKNSYIFLISLISFGRSLIAASYVSLVIFSACAIFALGSFLLLVDVDRACRDADSGQAISIVDAAIAKARLIDAA
jgi:hypothetical protein